MRLDGRFKQGGKDECDELRRLAVELKIRALLQWLIGSVSGGRSLFKTVTFGCLLDLVRMRSVEERVYVVDLMD